MHGLLRCAFVLVLADIIMVNMRVMSTVVESFEAYELVPDIVPKAPTGLVTVHYPSGVDVLEGNVLTPLQVKDAPTVCTWDASPDDLYTLYVADIDAPSKYDKRFTEWIQWHIVNIVGNQIETGEIISEYVGSGPPPDTGLHRYVFLVYKQPEKLDVDEPRLSATAGKYRKRFDIAKFVAKYNLGDPVAGNFFYAEWDDSVPILYQQLGLIWEA